MIERVELWMRFFMYGFIIWTCLHVSEAVNRPIKHIVHVFVEPEVTETVPPVPDNNHNKDPYNYDFKPKTDRKGTDTRI